MLSACNVRGAARWSFVNLIWERCSRSLAQLSVATPAGLSGPGLASRPLSYSVWSELASAFTTVGA